MSSGVERCRAVCRAVSSGVERCRGVSRCRVWHLDTVEHGTSLDGVEGCRGVSSWSSWHGVSRCRVGVELVSRFGVEVSRPGLSVDPELTRGCALGPPVGLSPLFTLEFSQQKVGR